MPVRDAERERKIWKVTMFIGYFQTPSKCSKKHKPQHNRSQCTAHRMLPLLIPDKCCASQSTPSGIDCRLIITIITVSWGYSKPEKMMELVHEILVLGNDQNMRSNKGTGRLAAKRFPRKNNPGLYRSNGVRMLDIGQA